MTRGWATIHEMTHNLFKGVPHIFPYYPHYLFRTLFTRRYSVNALMTQFRLPHFLHFLHSLLPTRSGSPFLSISFTVTRLRILYSSANGSYTSSYVSLVVFDSPVVTLVYVSPYFVGVPRPLLNHLSSVFLYSPPPSTSHPPLSKLPCHSLNRLPFSKIQKFILYYTTYIQDLILNYCSGRD